MGSGRLLAQIITMGLLSKSTPSCEIENNNNKKKRERKKEENKIILVKRGDIYMYIYIHIHIYIYIYTYSIYESKKFNYTSLINNFRVYIIG